LEVERIAACWWKLGRAWRYENSEIAYELIDVEKSRLGLIRPIEPASDSHLSSEYGTLDLLRKAKAEIVATGKISDELKAKMAAADERFQQVWAWVENWDNEKNDRFVKSLSSENALWPSDSVCSTNLLLQTIGFTIHFLDQGVKSVVNHNTTRPWDRAAVPKGDALDRILRADAAAERNLGRAMDRLERLQFCKTKPTSLLVS
jgi:hypothetical protein